MKNTTEIRGKTYDRAGVVMERFGIGHNTIWNWQKRGLLPVPLKLGKLRYYDRAEVDARVAKGE